jgi:hypothetical protein
MSSWSAKTTGGCCGGGSKRVAVAICCGCSAGSGGCVYGPLVVLCAFAKGSSGLMQRANRSAATVAGALLQGLLHRLHAHALDTHHRCVHNAKL